MTRSEFEQVILLVCPNCARGMKLRQRADNKEFVHDNHHGSTFSTTLCWASGLRNSHFASELTDG